VKLTRVLTQPLQRRLDPFLMLDAFGTDNPQDYIGGFRTIRIAASRPSRT
jgi:redox-sensitive bicupin YhaK (pirin superfamily)